MRAGKLDNFVTISRTTFEDDGYGGSIEVTTPVGTFPAQIISESTEEFIRNYGASSETVKVFRIRHVDGITLTDAVTHDGAQYNLKEIKPIGRRRGLELRCEAVGG